MRTNFRQSLFTTAGAALIALGGAIGTASAQTYITTTEPVVREPLTLTPAQRTTVYRTIVPQGRGKQPIVRERVVTETMGSGAAMRERVLVDPAPQRRVVIDQWGRERVIDAPTEIDYVVGDRVPAAVPLSPFPERIVREIPATNGYRYTVINDRAYVVDPVTNTVVEEIAR